MFFFFFNDTATTEIYTLSLHDALPIYRSRRRSLDARRRPRPWGNTRSPPCHRRRSEEHTSELQSQSNLVCRLLLEKKKQGKLPDLRVRELPDCGPVLSRRSASVHCRRD